MSVSTPSFYLDCDTDANDRSGNAVSITPNTVGGNSPTFGSNKMSLAGGANLSLSVNITGKALSYSAWIQPTSLAGTFQNLITNSGGTHGCWLEQGGANAGKLDIFDSGLSQGSTACSTSVEQHVGFTMSADRSAIKFYFAGAPDGTGSQSAVWASIQQIGNDTAASLSEPFAGTMRDIGVWVDEILSDADMAFLGASPKKFADLSGGGAAKVPFNLFQHSA